MSFKNIRKSNSNPKTEAHQKAEFFTLLLSYAISEPGIINQAYRAFHNFSIGNQMLAAQQLMERGLKLSPIASFKSWQEKGRHVKRGQSAISLYMPVTFKKKEIDIESGEEIETGLQRFVMRPHWFSFEQTDGGEDYMPEVVASAWDAELAMLNLDIKEEAFNDLRGNVMGYARCRNIAINPLNPFKHKTRFHEMAHIILGHTSETEMQDMPELSRGIKEVEAESVAFILCCIFELPGQAESRSYIQNWLSGKSLPESSAKRIFGAADKILKAGQN